MLAEGVVDAHGVPGLIEFAEQGLDDGGEEKPVVEAGLDLAGFNEGADEVVFGGGVELGPELVGGADDGEGEEGGVDDGLLVVAEVESVGGLGITAVLDGEAGPLAIAGAELFFFRSGPGSASSQGASPQSRRPTASRWVDCVRAASSAFGALDGHGGAELLLADGFEDRLRDLLDNGEPFFAVVGAGGCLWFFCGCVGCGGGEEWRGGEECAF